MAEISSLVPINRIEIWSPVETSSGISSSAFNFSSTFFLGGGGGCKDSLPSTQVFADKYHKTFYRLIRHFVLLTNKHNQNSRTSSCLYFTEKASAEISVFSRNLDVASDSINGF